MLTDLQLLAQRLAIEPAALNAFAQLDLEQAEALRLAVEARLARCGAGTFKRLAGASKYVPSSLNARIAENRLGPIMTAGMAAYLEPEAAAKIARKFSPTFIADLVPHLYGDAFAEIMVLLPQELVISVVRLLDERGEHLLLAVLVEAVSAASAAQLVAALSTAGLQAVVPLVRRLEVMLNIIAQMPEADRDAVMANVVGLN